MTTDGITASNVDYVSDQMSAYGDIIMASDLLTGKETAFVFGNGLISFHEQSGTAYYYKLDIRESVTGIYDSYGRSVTDIRYDEFGILENPEAALVKGNIFSYTGYVYGEITHLYYAKARYYDPEKGRMISLDLLKDRKNWYVYCGNNPIMYIDPSGMITIPWEDVWRELGKHASETWWLTLVDGVLPAGEAVFIFSLAVEIVEVLNIKMTVKEGISRVEMPQERKEMMASIWQSIRNSEEEDDYDDSYDDLYDQAQNNKRIGRQNGNAPRNNKVQNEQFDKVAKELSLNKKQQEQLHRYIGKQGYGFKELLDVAKKLFNK